MTPDVSIVAVSDYKPGEAKSWEDFRKALRALANQDFIGTFEILLIEEERFANQIPTDIPEILPNTRIVTARETNSYALANVGVKRARGAKVVLLDADCVPAPGWLSSFSTTMDRYPDAAVVSGLTRYPGRTLTERCLSLLSRSYVDPGRRGYTEHISNNNAGYRHDAFLQCPLPTDQGIYASRVQAKALRRAGYRMVFEPDMAVIHDYEGWDMERHIRRTMAHGHVLIRQRDSSLPYAWIVRLGIAGIPLFVAARTLLTFWKCVTVGGNYGVRPWQVPYALLLAVRVHLMEIPGMLLAHRGQPIADTVYR